MPDDIRRASIVAIALLVLCTLLICQRAQAHTAIRWEQPDYRPGDRWEVQWGPCSVAPGWRPLEPMWGGDGVWGSLMLPAADCAAIARVWRDGQVSEASAPRVYVPEPARWVLLEVGVPAVFGLCWASRRLD